MDHSAKPGQRDRPQSEAHLFVLSRDHAPTWLNQRVGRGVFGLDTIFVLTIAAIVYFYVIKVGTISHGFMSYAMAGLCIAHLYWYRFKSDLVAFSFGLIPLLALVRLTHPWDPFLVIPLSGLSSGLVLCTRWAYARNEPRSRIELVVAPALMILIFSNVAEIPQLVTLVYRKTLDDNLLFLDGLLGFQPSYALASFVFSHPRVFVFVQAWYEALGLGLIAVLVPISMDKPRVRSLIRTLMVSGILGFVIYNVVPAVGPIHSFPGFPWSTSSAQPQPGPRNCFPSLHMAWAVLMLLYAPRGWARKLAIAFVVMTIIATLGLGEHYAVDLLVAIPFATMVYALEQKPRPISHIFVVAGFVVLWTLMARAPWTISPVGLRLTAITSLAVVSFSMARMLMKNKFVDQNSSVPKPTRNFEIKKPEQANPAVFDMHGAERASVVVK